MTLLLDEQPGPKDADNTPKALQHKAADSDGPRWGRRLLIGTGIALSVIGVATVAIAAPHLDEGTGDRNYNPTTFAEVKDHYEFGIGSLDVDLRDVEFPPGVHVITVDHGIGAARVWLPADVNYDVTGDLDIGEIDVFGETEDGFSNEVDVQADADGAATVIVDLEVDIGYGQVVSLAVVVLGAGIDRQKDQRG